MSIKNCTSLTIMDVGGNRLSGEVPAWIGDDSLLNLIVLNLRSNAFSGSIPSQLCYRQTIRILDLSQNNISGTIPSCISNFSVMAQEDSSGTPIIYKYLRGYVENRRDIGYYLDNVSVTWKGRGHDFGKNLGLLKVIDLSSNSLSGVIPDQVTSLLGLVGLNLSRNHLTGTIPPTVGRLSQLQSLDLSRNHLSGEIPAAMGSLSFLQYLDLSNNDFSGRVPSGTQLQSFNASAYSGNPKLCGPPLVKKCREDAVVKGSPSRDKADTHELAATAARSLAIGKCDVALVVGARLNWLLHFGEPPKWSKDVKFILVDISKEEIEMRNPCLGLVGDAAKIMEMINKEIKNDPFCLGKSHPWVEAISKKSKENVSRMEAQLAKDVVPFNFLTPMRIIRDAILGVGSPAPILVSEGANTMDVGRSVLIQTEPRTRLDAGTWGTMGVGLGYCIAAAVASPDRLVVAVEGDSGFGFSAMEVETLVRYKLPVVIIVFNNGGVYGGDRRSSEEITGLYKDDPAPTSFVPDAAYHKLIEAFGGHGYLVGTPSELQSALAESFSARKPAVINVIIDPYAGSESGRMQHKN